ncbi:MAG: choice-of-anchor J domain-containing protein [Saprospiraceae bacterium]|nr:choice-of-anchor J domain-containing protein [Saprospiraceae bacterium]
MRILKTLLMVVVLVCHGLAQQPTTPLAQAIELAFAKQQASQPLELLKWTTGLEPEMRNTARQGDLYALDQTILDQLLKQRPKQITLRLVGENGKAFLLDLITHQVTSQDFQVNTSSGRIQGPASDEGLHYQGIVRGMPGSLAAISLFKGMVMGVINHPKWGQLVVGPLADDPLGRTVIYASDDLLLPFHFECGALDSPENHPSGNQRAANPNNCVRIYFECEYDTYLEKGSVQNVVNFMTGIYNVVKTLYDNESVNTIVSEIFVWDTPDNYATSSTIDALNSFRTFRTTYNGDVAHLVSRGAPTGGGVAWLDVLCNSNYSYAYSYIYAYYSQFPTYSWTIEVITHEMGHNLGANHTHDCVWDVNGDGNANEAVDGCGPAAGYGGSPGGCPNGPMPTNGGTIMSYCHLVNGVGINFNNGFGTLPGNRIRDRVYNGSCLSPCANCPITLDLTSTDVACFGDANGSASVTASNGIPPYTYLWSNGATTASITGLTAGSYSVTVTDENGNGCEATGSVTIAQPSALALSATVIPESLPGANDGAIDLSVAGGTTPYSYIWSNGPTSQDIQNLAAGTYTVTVTDGNACTSTLSVTVESNSCEFEVTSFPYAESFESGFGLWTQPTNDDFNWTRKSGSTPSKKTGPSSAFDGNWYVYTEASNNFGAAHLVSPCLDLSGFDDASTGFAYHMYGNNMGTLSLQVSVNNGGSWTTLWNLSGNQGNAWHTASVSLSGYLTAYTRLRFIGTVSGGQQGDMAIDAILVDGLIPPCMAPTLSLASTPTSCAGGNDGSANVSASGGQAPYSYLWSNGVTSQHNPNVPAGDYLVTVTDNTGCSATGGISVSEPPPILLTFAVTPVSGPGAQDGAIDLTVTQGNAPYTYLWSNNETSEDLTDLDPGTYFVTVTDIQGCSQTGSALVMEAPSCDNMVGIPYNEGFEAGLGLWQQATDDQFDWTRNSGSTPTKNTGPSNALEGSWYMYTEANGVSTGDNASLISPCMDLTAASSPVVQYSYHMYGSQMGSMAVDISTDNGNSWTQLWTQSGNHGNSWLTHSLSLGAYAGAIARLRFRGTRGGVRSDMAIDHIQIFEGQPLPERFQATPISSWSLNALHPNPAREQVVLDLLASEPVDLPVWLIDPLGRREYLGKNYFPAGPNQLTIYLGDRIPGLYLLSIGEGKDQQTHRLMIQ